MSCLLEFGGAGGGGTPAGPSGAVQFNNAGAFGGDAGFTYAGSGQATLALGTITTNVKALNITGTWNAAGVTFDAPLFMNITNTASNASSLLIDTQVGGSSVFNVGVSGSVTQTSNLWLKSAVSTSGIGFGTAFDASLSYAGANTLSVDNGNFNTATGTLNLANLKVSTSIFGFNNTGTNGAGSNITQTPALSTGGGAPGNWIVQNGFSGTGAAGTATISNASPAVITEAAHNYFVGEPFTLTTTGTLPTGFSTLTTYYIISAGFAAGSFEASATFGGAAINTSTAGSGTHTVNPGGVCTISNASPAVITLNNHGLVPGMTVQFSANGGTLPTGISAATNYFVLNDSGLTVNAFHVSASLNGAAVNTSSAGSGTFTVLYQGGSVQNPSYAVGTWGPSQLTGAQTTPALLINQVWNTTTGVPDAAFAINVTNVGQVAGSFITDWQVGGKSFFQLGVGLAISANLPNAGVGPNSTTLMIYNVNAAQYERGGLDWCTTGNVLTLGTGGSVSARDVQIAVGNGLYIGTNRQGALTNNVCLNSSVSLGWTTSNSPTVNVNDTNLIRNGAAGTLALFNNNAPTTGTAFRVYNTIDSTVSPTNYERGVLDWTTTANVLTVGTQKGGTGSARDVAIVSTGQLRLFGSAATSGQFATNTNGASGVGVGTQSSGYYMWTSGTDPASIPDTSIARTAAGVLVFGTGTAGGGGFYQWGGQTRVTADVTFTSTTTLGTVTGLSVNVQAGRTYCFVAELSWTDAAAGGLQLAISGTATATNIIYDGYIIDSAANGIKGNAQATALGGVVASAVTTGTAGHARIAGTITVNAAGTLLVQAAQNTSNATATTIKRGSFFYVWDNA